MVLILWKSTASSAPKQARTDRFMTFSNWVSGLKCNIVKANAAVYKELMLEFASGYVTCALVFYYACDRTRVRLSFRQCSTATVWNFFGRIY